ncbi:MAG: hypothetical protein KGP34_07455 [Bacteroidetes bacterium]|nr:hypothetical protein [Bacteroidota bacterium]
MNIPFSQQNAWLAFLNEVLQEDLTMYAPDFGLNNLIYWDSMARLVIFARLSETKADISAAEFKKIATIDELIRLGHPNENV